MEIKTVSVEVKAGPDAGLAEGEFVVYPSTFTKTPDSWGDIVAPGAFTKTIADWKASGNVLPGLYGHRMDDPDYFVAGAQDMGEDEHGWWVKGAFDLDNPKAQQVYKLAKGRRLNQLSFAYDTLDSGTVTLPDGTQARELRQVQVYEFSFVPVGANQDTSIIAIKAFVADVKAGRVLSAKNESALRDARDAIDSVLASLGDADTGKSTPPVGGTATDKASGHTEAKDEEPDHPADEEPEGAKSGEQEAKSEEPRVNPSARVIAGLQLLALD